MDHEDTGESGSGKKPYPVGYGKPPKHTQFKAGRSGNPAGRPPGSTSIGCMLRKAASKMLNDEIVANMPGQQVKMKTVDALYKKGAADALTGKPQLLGALMPLTLKSELDAAKIKEKRRQRKAERRAAALAAAVAVPIEGINYKVSIAFVQSEANDGWTQSDGIAVPGTDELPVIDGVSRVVEPDPAMPATVDQTVETASPSGAADEKAAATGDDGSKPSATGQDSHIGFKG